METMGKLVSRLTTQYLQKHDMEYSRATGMLEGLLSTSLERLSVEDRDFVLKVFEAMATK